MLLKDKVAVITGASRGIGRAIALKMAAAGAQVVINYNRHLAGAEETLSMVRETGGEGIIIQGDISLREDCVTLAKQTLAKFDKIDILINNAGITRDNIVARMKFEEWQQVIDINLTGAFNCTQAFMRSFIRQKTGGSIINISSITGITGAAGQANYAAAKAGLIGFTKSLARELASRKITVNAIAPGFIETEMTAVLSVKTQESILSLIPLGRTGKPEEVAAAALFLVSVGEYITGQVICVDGGLSI